MKQNRLVSLSVVASFLVTTLIGVAFADEPKDRKDLSADPTEASFVLQGRIKNPSTSEQEAKLIYSVRTQTKTQVEPKAITQTCEFKTSVIQGRLKELPLAMWGAGEVTKVTGEHLRDWSIRVVAPDRRFLVLRPIEFPTNAPTPTNFTFIVTSAYAIKKLPLTTEPLTLVPEDAMGFEGSLEVNANDVLEIVATNRTGVAPFRLEPVTTNGTASSKEPLRFRFSAENHSLQLSIREKDSDLRQVTFEKFQLTGELKDQFATFVLTGEAIVNNPEGGTMMVLSGDAALTKVPTNAELILDHGRYILRFPKPGKYPIDLQFHAKVTPRDGWNTLNFEVVSGSLRPVTLNGVGADTQFQFPGAIKPERVGDTFVTSLPSHGKVDLQWKQAANEELGKLFYSVQGIARMSVGSGLLRQAHVMEFKVMQGELTQIVFDLTGDGEVSRIIGEDILNWKTDGDKTGPRKLTIQLNQAHKDRYTVVVQTQTPLGQFPLKIEPVRIVPTQAIRFGGHLLIANDGAVRLEVTDSRGLSQISPELFPQSKELPDPGAQSRNQAFAYRFSGGDFTLSLQADHILPEVSVSQMLLYQISETESAIDAEIELDIREAPLREFLLRVPADFTVSRLTVAQLSDYSLTPDAEGGWAKLKILFTSPLSGRQVLQLRLEKNQNVVVGPWSLPMLTPQNVKSVRGYVGVAADTGFRVAASKITGLTEIANAYFPRKIANLQAAYRLREEGWEATMTVERLALSVRADATHLFTVSEGIVYGSSVLNYLISGSPISMLRISAPAEYNNLEFAGRDVRNWKKTTAGYEVYLHTPVFGTYTLLATYDRQFSAKNNTVSFVGVHPLDAQNEQGSVFVVSDQQLQVQPTEITSGLLQLDPGEIPPEHRLLFDAPILAAYQYTGRPFDIQLTLKSLALGETVHQVVDRAVIETHLSREGEVVTTVHYFLKSQGHSHFRLTVPKDGQLWEAKVNGAKVVPVADKNDTLIPLPTKADPSAVLTVDLKLATKSADRESVRLAAPAIAAPVLLSEWKVTPDEKYEVAFIEGNIEPKMRENRSGFAWLVNVTRGHYYNQARTLLLAFPVLLVAGVLLQRRATGKGMLRGTTSHTLSTFAGGCATLAGLGCLIALIVIAAGDAASSANGLNFTAPIQETGHALAITVKNIETGRLGISLWSAWPALLAVVLWGYLIMMARPDSNKRKLGGLLAWTLLCWAALRSAGGAPLFFVVLIAFIIIEVVVPFLKYQSRLPRKSEDTAGTPPAVGPAAALIMIGLFSWTALTSAAEPKNKGEITSTLTRQENVVHSVIQQGRVVEGLATVKATLIWKADSGQKLDFITAPAVLTKIEYPNATVQLSESQSGDVAVQRLTAREAGQFEVRFEYQVAVQKATDHSWFSLPTPKAGVNRMNLEIEKSDADVFSSNAVSVQTSRGKQANLDLTSAEIVFMPVAKPAVGWRPRTRNIRSEKAVFYSEWTHLMVPTAGIIEGVHDVQVRPAQGQLREVSFTIPVKLTVTDVQAEFVSSWRFDPDQRLLRVQFSSAQSRPFALRLRSQFATIPLPYEQTVGVIAMVGSAGEVGVVGIATGSEVQLDAVKESKLSAINLEDFPSGITAEIGKQIPNLTVRRTFRYSAVETTIMISASAVQPDVRVETQETLSLGEDRTVLASQMNLQITRAGIFKLSFVLPQDFEVESLTGPALSHWTELKTDGERIITLHLRGKTEGSQQFSISLAGPGIGTRKEWKAPRLTLREAAKQTGQLVLVPELGVRLHIKTPDGVSQLDPRKAGVTQKGVLAFRLLKPDWQLQFDIETVESWIQVASLQDVTVREGQILVAAQLDYQIENAGIKSLMLQLPAAAENVRFEGELVSDFVRTAGTNSFENYEVKLQRRVINNYPLRVTYQLSLTNQPSSFRLVGVKAKNANLQRGYLAVRAVGRLQVQFPQLPAGMQRTEWQSIPAPLRTGRDLAESKDTFITLETDFELPITLSRHEVAKVLPARVEKIDLTSVISASGEMITEGRLLMQAGDKRLLRLKLPTGGQFWYAFVNGESAWPWREGDQILLLLEKNSDPAKPTTVEFFYTCQTEARSGSFDHQLLGPSFDLPLENITWQVFVPENWKVKDWESSLQLRSETASIIPIHLNVDSYIQTETARLDEKSKEAEGLLNMGNDFLQKGTPQQARRAYEAAWRLSPQDAAFNEDARVQLHNLKTQQALLGLNQRRMAAFDETKKGDGKDVKSPFTRWSAGESPDYTQQQAQQALDQNAAEDNATLMRLAERLIRQQDAGIAKPESIHAALPAQGKQLTFTGSLQVKEWSDLRVKLDTRTLSSHPWALHLGMLIFLFAGLCVVAGLTSKARQT